VTWFKVDDGFYDHPKVKAIPRRQRQGAVALWTLAGSWCCRYLTDGIVPAHMIEEFGASVKDAESLVNTGLWEDCGGSYLFHDWVEFQFTREQVETERAAARARMMHRRRNRGEKPPPQDPEEKP
jgi:hypothetical protein